MPTEDVMFGQFCNCAEFLWILALLLNWVTLEYISSPSQHVTSFWPATPHMWQLRRHICNIGFCLHNHRPLSSESTHIDFSILHERRDGHSSQKLQLTKPFHSENTLGVHPLSSCRVSCFLEIRVYLLGKTSPSKCVLQLRNIAWSCTIIFITWYWIILGEGGCYIFRWLHLNMTKEWWSVFGIIIFSE